jgi:ATP-dependent Clp protease protease subunit
MLLVRERINNIMAKHTGKNSEQILRDTDRDNFMGAQQAIDYGLIDAILTVRTEVGKVKESLATSPVD